MHTKRHQSFTLEVWKKARALKNELFQLIQAFPSEERYRLSDQIVRCSRSVTANIAEGHGRFTSKDQIHFCIQARGSLSEVLNHLIDAYDCRYISEEKLLDLKSKIAEVERILNGYIGYLRGNLVKGSSDHLIS